MSWIMDKIAGVNQELWRCIYLDKQQYYMFGKRSIDVNKEVVKVNIFVDVFGFE